MTTRTRGLLAVLLGVALALVAVLGVVPREALADGTTYDPASGYTYYGTLNTNDTTVKIDGVKYNDSDVDWYVIGYDSTAKTVTLLSKQRLGTSAFGTNNTYGGSTVEMYWRA